MPTRLTSATVALLPSTLGSAALPMAGPARARTESVPSAVRMLPPSSASASTEILMPSASRSLRLHNVAEIQALVAYLANACPACLVPSYLTCAVFPTLSASAGDPATSTGSAKPTPTMISSPAP